MLTFSPREVQSRVRAGASAEAVADDTGWPLDKVMRYAEPLLAERAYIAEQAQVVEVRRSGGGATLQQAASAALGIDASSDKVEWDSWRREDGKWVVSVAYPDRGKTKVAQWTYDPAGRNIHPLDDNARALMGVRTLDDDRDPIADALDLVSVEVEDEPGDARRPRLVAVPDADENPTQPAEDAETTVTIAHPSTPATTPAATPPAASPPARKPKTRKGRASVPSWDEILFGATRPEDKS
ncbi:MAG: septation protein SepH [Actinomycetota bacterium]|nr:septation protein SepH [Actinomycetota bacterium]